VNRTRTGGRALVAVMAAILVCLGGPGCTSVTRAPDGQYTPPQNKFPGDGETLFREARILENKQRNDDALAVYHRVVQGWPAGRYAPEALNRSAHILMKQERYAEAAVRFQNLVKNYKTSPHVKDATFKLGQCLYEVRDYQGVINAMTSYLNFGTGLGMVTKAKLYVARSLVAQEKYAYGIAWFGKALDSTRSGVTREMILSEVDAILMLWKEPEPLVEVLKEAGGGIVADHVMMRLAKLYLSQNKVDQARFLLTQIVSSGREGGLYREASELLGPLSGDELGSGPAIGVALPLSGRYAVYGEQALRGVLLGMGFFDPPPEGTAPVRVVVMDSEGNSEVADDCVKRLASNPNVVAVLGPLLSVTASSAAQTAQLLRMPIVVMSRKEGIADMGEFVFRNFLTNSEQVRALVSYAALNYGATGFAVLYPNNGYGRELKDLFVEEVLQAGFAVAVAAAYDAGQTDFKAQMAEIKAAMDRGEAVDAVFIPDFHDKIVLMAPQFPFYEVEDVLLLGTNAWNSPELSTLAGTYLSRSLFTDAFFPDADVPLVRRFVERYRALAGEEPTFLAAVARDSAALLAGALVGGEWTDRAGFARLLSGASEIQGVCGTFSFAPNGDVQRSLYMLRAAPRGIVQVY